MTLSEPTNPNWPENVLIFRDTQTANEIMEDIKKTSDATKKYTMPDGTDGITYTSENHFSTKHYALLFTPGVYDKCKFEVGYYVQMAGLGKSPKDVRFTGEESGPFVEALNKHMPHEGSIAAEGSVSDVINIETN